MMKKYLSFIVVMTLASCGHAPERPASHPSSGGQSSRYTVDQDYSPETLLDPKRIQDAIPREEYVTKAGNKSPYTVLGKTYRVLPTAKGYRDEGKASWYGLKFQGHQTSNGETYDIYQMTAAHKTLPIPCYVKVTNKDNGKSAIVRVNDRGPFHDGRIIDVSYAAATKLGFIGKGTANVIVEAIDPKKWQATSGATVKPVHVNQVASSAAPAGASSGLQPGYIYLQVGAYLEEAIANDVHNKLYNTYASAVSIESGRDQYYRVRIGPVSEDDVDQITRNLLQQGFPKPIRVR